MSLTEKQAYALDVLKNGHNVFLSGEAGTGKSYVIDKFSSYLQKEGIKYVICAPTGLAAININGATLHRTFKLSTSLGDASVDLKNVEEAQVIIIDEISMCRRDIFQYIARALIDFANPIKEFDIKKERRIVRKKQIVVVGDFFQLPPVLGNNDRKIIEQLKSLEYKEFYKDLLNLEETIYAFQCKEWEELGFRSIVLDEVLRQNNKDYIDNLNKIRKGDEEGLEFIKKEASKEEIKNAIYITSKNKDAENLNSNNLEKIKEKEYTFYAEENGEVAETDKPVPKFLKFKIGARVMSVVNIKEKDNEDNVMVVNGMMGTITNLNDTYVTVEFDNGCKYKFEKYKWSIKGFKKVKTKDVNGKSTEKMVMEEIGTYKQIPLKLAWAITIHKSQGQTYESVNLNPDCFTEGQLYVALSRAKDIKRLYLTSNLRKSYLKTSAVVKEFYKKIENNTAINNREDVANLEEDNSRIQLELNAKNESREDLQKIIDILNKEIESLKAELAQTKLSAKRRPKISKEKENKIIKLRQAGMGMNKIAKMVGCGDGTVKRVLKDNNIN